MKLTEATQQLITRQSLSETESYGLFNRIMTGAEDPVQIAAFLGSLATKGETVQELFGAVQALREQTVRFHAPKGAIDTCGTGGDGHATYNISTAVSFVLAGCGVPVAKHGNRAITSSSGSSDVLSALGVRIDASTLTMESALQEAHVAFMMAPLYYPAMRHVAEIRKKLGFRTIFNLLGPLANPAHADYQLVGVFDPRWLDPFAVVLQKLGVKRAWVVYGKDGLDEITTTDSTEVAELSADGNIRHFTINPEDVGLPRATMEQLKGSDPQANAHALRELLEGKPSAYRDIVLFNAAAGLLIAGQTDTLEAGVTVAGQSIDEGRAKHALHKLIEITDQDTAP
jgi:anthranilate phosphoribosyltransferase